MAEVAVKALVNGVDVSALDIMVEGPLGAAAFNNEGVADVAYIET